MYYCVSEIQLDLDCVTTHDAKILSALCQKIRQRHKVNCVSEQEQDLGARILVCFFANNEMQAGQALDRILSTIETDGIGRVVDEATLVEHVDVIRQEDKKKFR